MLEFAIETVMDAADEAAPLLRHHFDEVETHRDVSPLEPDWPRYVAMEEMGLLKVFTARDAGMLVGYAVFGVMPSMHSKNVVHAINDIVYIKPAYRRGTNAIRFILWMEKQMKSMGAMRIFFNVKTAHDWSPVLEYLGYDAEEIVMGKAL
jgi:hypothetical protein